MIVRYNRVLLVPLLLYVIFHLELIMVYIQELLLLLLLVVQLVRLLHQLLHHTRFYSTKLSFFTELLVYQHAISNEEQLVFKRRLVVFSSSAAENIQ